MISEFAAGIAGLKTVGELASLLIKMNVDNAVTQKAIEANTAIINAQTLMLELQAKYQELLVQKDELEKRLIQIENWDAEAQKYALTEIVEGVFVYALKADQKDGAPAHWLCPDCYQNKKKSILQFQYSRTASSLSQRS
jgi:hypothetical protein